MHWAVDEGDLAALLLWLVAHPNEANGIAPARRFIPQPRSAAAGAEHRDGQGGCGAARVPISPFRRTSSTV